MGPRRCALLAVLAANLLPAAAAAQQGVQGCVATEPAGTRPNPCTFKAAGDGAYAGRGDWTITIERGGRTLVLHSGQAPDVGPPGALRAGDVVTAHARSAGSAVAVSRAISVSGTTSGCPETAYGTGGTPRPESPDDPLFDRQWPLQTLHVPEAWRGGRGGGAVVAVVDTGVDLRHPDLRDRLLPGIDLWETRPGGTPDCAGPQDEQYHGTLVAGVIAAEADNGIGIAGVAPAARLLPVRVRDTVESTDFSRVGAGIRWAADNGADVISLTGGAVLPIRPAPVLQEDIAEAAAYAWARGAVTVATAGNTGLPWCQYPSASPHIVCAAADGRDGDRADYSQAPVRADGGLAVRAPGGSGHGTCDADDDVWSTSLPGAPDVDGCGDVGYATDFGTTFATAHTAGVAALLAGRRLSNAEVVACLRASAAGAGSPADGAGSIDAARAVACAGRRR